ncbi:DUF927 domain-containing protein [Methylocaldum sp. MU1018]
MYNHFQNQDTTMLNDIQTSTRQDNDKTVLTDVQGQSSSIDNSIPSQQSEDDEAFAAWRAEYDEYCERKLEENLKTPIVNFTIYTKATETDENGVEKPGILTKIIYKDESGKVQKDASECRMVLGHAETIETHFGFFRRYLELAWTNQAFGYGICQEHKQIHVASRGLIDRYGDTGKAVTRTGDNFRYTDAPAILMIDHDPSKWAPRLQDRDEFLAALEEICPAMKSAARIITTSTSSSIKDKATGELVSDSGGMHVYFPVPRGSDIERFGAALFKRLWLADWGYIALAKNGAKLVRAIIDGAVFSPERLDFVAGAVVGEGLYQDRPAPEYRPGGYLDTTTLPDLTPDEEREFAALVDERKAAIEGKSKSVFESYVEERADELVSSRGIDRETAVRTIRASASPESADLYESFLLDFDREGVVTVRDVLDDPQRYNGKTLADPIEGAAYGRGKAQFFWNGGKPVVNSFAHGGRVYYLHRDLIQIDLEALERESVEYFAEFPPIEDRPCYRVYEAWCGPEGKRPPGTYYHSAKKTGEKIDLIDERICGPLYIDAQCSDRRGRNFGRMLRFRDSLGNWKQWAMPMHMMSGSCEEIRSELYNLGLDIPHKNRGKISEYITSVYPKKTMRSALQVGWYDDSFVLPDRVIGNSQDVFFQSEHAWDSRYIQHGDIDGWRNGVSAMCVGNPIMIFKVSAAFAGALLKPCNLEGGGFHFHGPSSQGKSTGDKAAASVWGGPDYINSWKSTSNGLEAVATLFNDGLLCLDEMGDGEPAEIAKSIYALGNGTGKQRANIHGSAKPVNRWRVMVLSNGEKPIESHLAEKGLSAKAGQMMRLLQIPIFGRHGAFDELHGKSGQAFSDGVARCAATHYGVAGPQFLDRLVHDYRDFGGLLAELLGRFGEGLSSQESRAARRFAVVALAGEIASEYGITGWAPGTATEAALRCFAEWREKFGVLGGGNKETLDILKAVSDYVSLWGDARFTRAGDGVKLHGQRSGWWKDGTNGREWLFTEAGFAEALKGYDLNQAKKVLVSAGWMKMTRRTPEWVDGKNERCHKVAIMES